MVSVPKPLPCDGHMTIAQPRQPPPPLPRVVVVRHGESEWNVLGKWQGRADTSLTAAGRQQALDAGAHIAATGMTIDHIVASTLRRASETAAIIAKRLGLADPVLDERLVETDVGPWEGLRESEIEKGWPNFLRERRTPPNFEPADAVFARATTAIRELSAGGKRVLVISHSGVIRTVRRAMQVPDRRLHNLEGCYFGLDSCGVLVAGDFVALASGTRKPINDSV